MIRNLRSAQRFFSKARCARNLSQTGSNASTSLPYAYKPLQQNEVRVIHLYPGQHVEPLRCQIRHVDLAGNPPYESLSYCWGLDRPEAHIQCDGGVIPVTKNLFSALRHLRGERISRTLWIDAVCINQADIEERGYQVSLMKDIFQLSQRTVVWLGEEYEHSGLAIQLIRELAGASQERSARSWRSHISRKIPPLYDPAWQALAQLLQRPWFHRAWIVQEVSVPKDLLIVCGHATIPWDEFCRAVQYAVDLGLFIAYGGSATFQALSLFETRSDFQSNRLPSLHEILLRNRSFLATDARDKVFGLLSLANPDNVQSMRVRPNYHLTTEQLYKNITQLLLRKLDLTAFNASGVHNSSLEKKLPSWVSDWSASDPSVPLTSRESADFGECSPYLQSLAFYPCAAGTSISNPVIRDEEGLLGLEGVLIDQVETVGTLSRTRYLRHVSHMFELFVQCHDILEQLKNWEQVARARSGEQYLTGERQLDAYWKTLCAGRVPNELSLARQDPRFKYYIMIRSLRAFVRFTIRWFPRSERDSWYNRMFYNLFQTVWRVFGLTPAKIQRLGFPPESRLSNYRRIVRTRKGYLALAPRFTRSGDWIGVFKGGKLPLVVRKEDDYLELVGESYVHGIMKGEEWDENKCELMWFR
ncbi:HET-domain-containing protein [Lojkania enalia]|uniref:HET-domain-containing protein n=1 Tax=Lojkania enalia TaxID=147567 RepID=A0A9P4N481_9PLEO|nr:HET-domain-containing protein [Didymosphaeria enalia]